MHLRKCKVSKMTYLSLSLILPRTKILPVFFIAATKFCDKKIKK